MANSQSKIYLLFFKEKLIGSTNTALNGLGWISGFFDPAPRFSEFRDFFNELDDSEDNPEFYMPRMERKYGKAILDPGNWTLKDMQGRKVNSNIPYISGEMISWRG